MFSGYINDSIVIVSKLKYLLPEYVKIYDDSIDYSIIPTINLIVRKRAPEQKFEVYAKNYKYEEGAADIDDVLQDMKRRMSDDDPDKNMIYIGYAFNTGYHYEDKVDFYEKSDEYPVFKDDPDWEELVDINAYYSDGFPCRIFINRKHKTSFILTHVFNQKIWHALQGTITRQFPMYFENSRINKTEGDPEYDYLDSLIKASTGDYLAALEKLFNTTDYDKEWKERRILDMFKDMHEAKKQGLENELRNINDSIDTFFRNIAEQRRKADRTMLMLKGISVDDVADAKMLYSYIESTHGDVEYVNNDEETVSFTIESYLTTWNEDTAEADASNRNSSLYGYADDEYGLDEMMSLVKAIFVDKKYRIKLRHGFRFNMIDGNIEIYGVNLGEFCLHNPHLYENTCLGTYRDPIENMLTQHNLIGALEYAKASVGSVNLSEAISAKYLVKELENDDRRVIEDENGEMITVSEAIERLK